MHQWLARLSIYDGNLHHFFDDQYFAPTNSIVERAKQTEREYY